jgi:hypothetical protein
MCPCLPLDGPAVWLPFAGQFPICYHPSMEYQFDGADPLGPPTSHTDVVLLGWILPRRRAILDDMLAAGVSVTEIWNATSPGGVYEMRRSGDLALNIHQMAYEKCSLEVSWLHGFGGPYCLGACTIMFLPD